jgi:hypothetical protein
VISPPINLATSTGLRSEIAGQALTPEASGHLSAGAEPGARLHCPLLQAAFTGLPRARKVGTSDQD